MTACKFLSFSVWKDSFAFHGQISVNVLVSDFPYFSQFGYFCQNMKCSCFMTFVCCLSLDGCSRDLWIGVWLIVSLSGSGILVGLCLLAGCCSCHVFWAFVITYLVAFSLQWFIFLTLLSGYEKIRILLDSRINLERLSCLNFFQFLFIVCGFLIFSKQKFSIFVKIDSFSQHGIKSAIQSGVGKCYPMELQKKKPLGLFSLLQATSDWSEVLLAHLNLCSECAQKQNKALCCRETQ